MPASGVIKLADANAWLALAFSDHLHHAKSKAWFEEQPEGACAFLSCTQMALAAASHQFENHGAFVQSQQDAWTHYDKLARDPRVIFLDEPPGLEAAFRSSLKLPHHHTVVDGRVSRGVRDPNSVPACDV